MARFTRRRGDAEMKGVSRRGAEDAERMRAVAPTALKNAGQKGGAALTRGRAPLRPLRLCANPFFGLRVSAPGAR